MNMNRSKKHIDEIKKTNENIKVSMAEVLNDMKNDECIEVPLNSCKVNQLAMDLTILSRMSVDLEELLDAIEDT